MRILSREKPPRSWAIGWPHGLAEQIPEGDVERRIAPRLRAGRTESEIAVQVSGDEIDLQRIAADQLRRNDLVNVGLHRLRRHESLAEAGEALRGVDAQPQQIAEFRQPDRFERDDLHAIEPSLREGSIAPAATAGEGRIERFSMTLTGKATAS